MSWMDSWSRPAKTQATPAPYYMLPGGEATPYCHSCGRVISTRRQTSTQHQKENNKKAAVGDTTVKYCSSRCRNRKPGKLDREIEGVFLRFLLGQENDDDKNKGKKKNMGGDEEVVAEAGITKTPAEKAKPANKGHGRGYQKYHQKEGKVKGDARLLVSCGMVEDEVFPHHGEHATEENEEQRPGSSCSSRSNSSSSHGSSQAEEEEDHRSHAQEQEPDHDDHANNQPPYREELLHDLDSYDALHPPHHHNDNDEIDGDVLARLSVRSGTRVRPPQSVSQVNGSVGGEKGRAERLDESEASLQKRMAGQRRAREREMVRCAARRGVVFGFAVAPEDDADHHHQPEDPEEMNGKGKKQKKKHAKKSSLGSSGTHDGEDGTREKRRLCEAVMNGKVVEPSFAKGNWSIRWREE
ncbi:cysteinyl-tRNA synthetase [Apiospora arundinis]